MSEHYRILRAIEEHKESLAAFRALKHTLQKDAVVFPDHRIGWQGGSGRCTVYWLHQIEIWAALEPSPPSIKKGTARRFWNGFGLGNPSKQKMLKITVEINPPHRGPDRRVAGVFARDEKNRIYIAHSGKVGGGGPGIGQKEFRKFCIGDLWHEIGTRDGGRMALVLGPIDSPDFPDQLAAFVHRVADFKESVKQGTGARRSHKRSGQTHLR